MSVKDWFKPKVEHIHHHHHDSDHRKGQHGSKYGKISYNNNFSFEDSSQRREIARKVNRESLTAGGIKRRLIDSVINTGMSWESTPLWDMITDAPESKEAKRNWTVNIENLWKLTADSTEFDIEGDRTFAKLQRLIFDLAFEEGEIFAIVRYLNDPTRISNVALQFINNDQVSTPINQMTNKKIKDGIEYNSAGQKVAIWVQPSYGEKHIGIPFFSPSGRRFVIHYKANEKFGDSRGIPEFASLSYELSRLTEVEINEIEKMASASMWLGAIETDKDANPKRINFQAMDDSSSTDTNNGSSAGIQQVDVGDKALIINELDPGQKFNIFKSEYTNTNLEKMIETYETRAAGEVGMPLSVYKQKFDASYNASRSAILFFWNNVLVRRDDIISEFLNPFKEVVVSEWVKDDTIKAPGFDTKKTVKLAWLYGIWNGTNKPEVDPVKQAKASELRRKLGDSTGEREAKNYNGSDFRENLEKLEEENILLAEVNKPLDPKQFIEESKSVSKSLTVVEDADGNEITPNGNSEESNESTGGIDFDSLKAEFDAYGVGVRAGAITPSPEDERHFRDISGFPGMTAEAEKFWNEEGNVRRPITLAMPGIIEDNLETVGKDPDNDTEKDEENEE